MTLRTRASRCVVFFRIQKRNVIRHRRIWQIKLQTREVLVQEPSLSRVFPARRLKDTPTEILRIDGLEELVLIASRRHNKQPRNPAGARGNGHDVATAGKRFPGEQEPVPARRLF